MLFQEPRCSYLSQSKALSVTETVAVASGRTSTQSVLKAYGPGT
jgi:hypothetical protein